MSCWVTFCVCCIAKKHVSSTVPFVLLHQHFTLTCKLSRFSSTSGNVTPILVTFGNWEMPHPNDPTCQKNGGSISSRKWTSFIPFPFQLPFQLFYQKNMSDSLPGQGSNQVQLQAVPGHREVLVGYSIRSVKFCEFSGSAKSILISDDWMVLLGSF